METREQCLGLTFSMSGICVPFPGKHEGQGNEAEFDHAVSEFRYA